MKAIFYDWKIVLINGKVAEYLEYVALLESLYGQESGNHYMLLQDSLSIYPISANGDPKLLDVVLKLLNDGVPMLPYNAKEVTD